MRVFSGLPMLLHGAAHLPGFVVSWRLAELAEMQYRTTLLAGALDVGDVGIRIVGVVWLVAAVGFWVAGAGALAGRAWWVPLALRVAALSLAGLAPALRFHWLRPRVVPAAA
jgi:hypothetical protein